MSRQNILTQQIPSLNNKHSRISIIGVGHPLFGDDYIGCWITDRLTELEFKNERIQIISAESKPENIIGPIVRFKPDHMILLDAVSGENNEEIAILSWQENMLLDTYLFSAPLSKFCTFIQRETGCKITLIGIQIGISEMALEVSESRKKTGLQLVEALWEILN